MNIVSFGGTDAGKKRQNNEDAFLLNDALCLYAVADGIGGNEGGEVASRIAIETLVESIPDLLSEKESTPSSERSVSSDPSVAALEHAVALSNEQIRQAQDRNDQLSGMGTTLTALLLGKRHAFIAHVGDSRAYLLRSGAFRQLTNDHSVVAEQILAGMITPEQARRSPYRHIITRALGSDEDVLVDTFSQTVQEGDIFLLCTDGLTEMVEDEKIGGILADSPPREAVKRLLAAANDQGGVDNITAVVVMIEKV